MSLPLHDALAQCARHATIMQQALQLIPDPLDAETLRADRPELIRLIDQFVLRYTKLQDTLGAHVLRPFAIQVLAEPVEDATFIDVLNLLERYGYLDAQQWNQQRGIRNALTHEYPDDPERQTLALNAARDAAAQLVTWLRRIADHTAKTLP